MQPEYDLPDVVREKVRILVDTKSNRYLSPNQESMPFTLYMLTGSLQKVAEKTQLPLEVVGYTAQHYRWKEKREMMESSGELAPERTLKRIANMMLHVASKAIEQELTDILTGKLDANSSSLMPSNPAALERLIDLVMKVNGLKQGMLDTPVPGTTVVHAQNVQINNQLPESSKEPIKDKAAILAEMARMKEEGK